VIKKRLIPLADKKLRETLIIIGATRSGTTLVENVVSSFKFVECFDEPPMIYALLSQSNFLDRDMLNFLFKSYIFEERLMMSVSGRNLNLNKKDQSSIYKSKNINDIKKRLNKSHRRISTLKNIDKYIASFKIVDVGKNIIELKKIFSQSKFILVLRKPLSVINSIINRGWYSNNQIKSISGISGKWIFKNNKNINYPHWLPSRLHSSFLKMKEVDRCALYYLFEYENFLKLIKNDKKNLIIFDYDDFILNPKKITNYINLKTNTNPSHETDLLLKKIKKQNTVISKRVSEINKKILYDCENIYIKCKKAALKSI
tara:strand:- start:431 stop:1375 length:945 start_codon:yes stop_codon:yes gene_type:complete